MKCFQFMSDFQPKIKYASVTTSTIELMDLDFGERSENTIVFCVNSDADLRIVTEHVSKSFAHHDFVTLFPDREYSFCLNGMQDGAGHNTCYTVAVEFQDCQCVWYDEHEVQSILHYQEGSMENKGIFLPEQMHLSQYQFRDVIKLMESIADHYAKAKRLDYAHYRCIAKWFELAALLDQCVRAEVFRASLHEKSEPYRVDYYVSKIKRYISAHYVEQISIPQIAKYIGVTPNYLSTLFKKGTGQTIITYLNHFRILKLQELLRESGSNNFEELCSVVGIQDERYARRLYKKFLGNNYGEIEKMDL